MLIIKKLRKYAVVIEIVKGGYKYRLITNFGGDDVILEGFEDKLRFGQDIVMYDELNNCYFVKLNACEFQISYGSQSDMLIGKANIVICK